MLFGRFERGDFAWSFTPHTVCVHGARPLRVLVVGDSVGSSFGNGLSAWAHATGNVEVLKEDLKPGAAFRVQAAAKQADGSYTAENINVGRDGARPF